MVLMVLMVVSPLSRGGLRSSVDIVSMHIYIYNGRVMTVGEKYQHVYLFQKVVLGDQTCTFLKKMSVDPKNIKEKNVVVSKQ